MKYSEKEIQEHIWSFRDEFAELIDELITPPIIEFGQDENAIEEVTAYKIIYNIVIQRIAELNDELRSVYLFGNEVPLGRPGETKIRADLLGKAEGLPGIFIFELKKDKLTERQAFTELLAYANQLNATFPSHCTDDTAFVLISPLLGKTIEDAFLQSLVFDRRRICILQPYFENEDDLTTLRLRPFMPSLEDVIVFSSSAFKKRNFDVQVYCWDYDDTFWNPKPDGQNIEYMNRVSALAAQLMEAKNIHGFVYTQQSWPELRKVVPLVNKLVLVGLNPYKIASDKYFTDNFPDVTDVEPPSLFEIGDEVDLSDLLPGLKKHTHIHKEWNYFTDLGQNWTSHLFQIGKQAVEFCTINKMKVKIHSEGVYGGSFNQYELNFLENVYVFNYDFRPTGVVRELYMETTRLDYTHWSTYESHPFYGDSFGWALENSESYILFEIFLRRMFSNDKEDLNNGPQDDEGAEDVQ